MAGTFAPSASLRGLVWGIDGVGLIMAGALLTLAFYRKGQDLVASGFLVFVVGEGLVLSGAAMDLAASVPSFGAGTSLLALALVLTAFRACFLCQCAFQGSSPPSCLRNHCRADLRRFQVTSTTAPLPFDAYPVLVATLVGWIWTLVKADPLPSSAG